MSLGSLPPRRLLRRPFALTLLVGALAGSGLSQSSIPFPEGERGTLVRTAGKVKCRSGSEMEAEIGTLLVPEWRNQPTERVVEIPFYRIESTAKSPAAPIFLLAGGPGSSWIDLIEREENFAEVEFYRGIADVVVFDQRGCGHARPELLRQEVMQFPLLEELTEASASKGMQRLSEACRARLIQGGIRLGAFNTEESARDVNDLRLALGYETITLVGGSYGSHLALTIMRLFPKSVERAMLYGIEGTDHTWDDPKGYVKTLQRIAAAAEASPTLGPQIPDCGLLAALQTVIDRLEEQPIRVAVSGRGESKEVLVDAFLVRRLAGYQAGRKSRINFWPEMILELYAGHYGVVAQGALAHRAMQLDDPIHYLMDLSSGISPQRRKLYSAGDEHRLVGDINLEYRALEATWQVPLLSREFREPFQCDAPTLIIHGTWDTSTPIENAREVAAMLGNATLVEVITGSHGALYNLFAHWKPAHEKLGKFLRGEDAGLPAEVRLPPVEFQPRTPR